MGQLITYFSLLILGFIILPFENLILKLFILIPILLIEVYCLKANPKKYRAGFIVGSITLICGMLLGEMWNDYVSFGGILTYGLSVLFSIIFIVVFGLFIFATSKREKEIRIERKEDKVTFKQQVNDYKRSFKSKIALFQSYRQYKKEGNPRMLAFQRAYVEHQESIKPPEKNAMDFNFLKEVAYERNKHDV